MTEKPNIQTDPPESLSDPRLHGDMSPVELREGLCILRLELLQENPKPWEHIRTLSHAIDKACEDAPITVQTGGYW